MIKQKYESVLVGWADEPSYNDNGELMGWSFRLKDNELKDCIDQYTRDVMKRSRRQRSIPPLHVEERQSMPSVWDPNSEAAQRRNTTIKTSDTETIPF